MSHQTLPPTARDVPRYDASVQRSPKNVFDREPVLIPQLFVDPPLPKWYRRPSRMALAGLSALTTGAIAIMLSQFGVAGTVHRVGRGGSSVLEGFVSVVVR